MSIFWLVFRGLLRKWRNMAQRLRNIGLHLSISLFHTQIIWADFLYLHFRFVTFWRTKIGRKSVLDVNDYVQVTVVPILATQSKDMAINNSSNNDKYNNNVWFMFMVRVGMMKVKWNVSFVNHKSRKLYDLSEMKPFSCSINDDKKVRPSSHDRFWHTVFGYYDNLIIFSSRFL